MNTRIVVLTGSNAGIGKAAVYNRCDRVSAALN